MEESAWLVTFGLIRLLFGFRRNAWTNAAPVLAVAAEQELVVPQKVETGDSVKMKQAMDEAVVKAVRDPGGKRIPTRFPSPPPTPAVGSLFL